MSGYSTFNGGGGTGGFADWSTVGSAGADYTTIGAAITAGKSKIVLITNLTEGASIAVPATGLQIYLNDYILTMAANQFTFSAAASLSIEGWNVGVSEIDYTQTASNQELIDVGVWTAGSIITLKNWKFDNNSTVNGTWICKDGVELHVDNLLVELPNKNNCGIITSSFNSTINDVVFLTGGSSTQDIFDLNKGKASNITFSGTFNSTTFSWTIGNGAVASNFITNGTIVGQNNGGKLNGLFAVSSFCKVFIGGNNSTLSNAKLGSNGDLDIQNSSNCLFSNISLSGAGNIDLTDVSANDNKFSNSDFAVAMTVAGDRNMFDNCTWTNDVTINAGAVRNQFSNCQVQGGSIIISDQTIVSGCVVGATAGGGVDTITVSAGTGTLLVGNLTDAAISDSGTSTVATSNVVY